MEPFIPVHGDFIYIMKEQMVSPSNMLYQANTKRWERTMMKLLFTLLLLSNTTFANESVIKSKTCNVFINSAKYNNGQRIPLDMRIAEGALWERGYNLVGSPRQSDFSLDLYVDCFTNIFWQKVCESKLTLSKQPGEIVAQASSTNALYITSYVDFQNTASQLPFCQLTY